jgi:hypothetical protein
MQAAADFRQERHELDSILASGILNRAPNLAQVLTYVCTKYFEGAAEQIKEYNIAVEALGRPADFDQRDSIVRVGRIAARAAGILWVDGSGHAIESTFHRANAPRRPPAPTAELERETLAAPGEALRALARGCRAHGGAARADSAHRRHPGAMRGLVSDAKRGHRHPVAAAAPAVALWRN